MKGGRMLSACSNTISLTFFAYRMHIIFGFWQLREKDAFPFLRINSDWCKSTMVNPLLFVSECFRDGTITSLCPTLLCGGGRGEISLLFKRETVSSSFPLQILLYLSVCVIVFVGFLSLIPHSCKFSNWVPASSISSPWSQSMPHAWEELIGSFHSSLKEPHF